MKMLQIDGRIGASGAEVRTTKGGKQYVRFSVANNSFANGTEKTEWYDVTSYDSYIIENRVKYLTKGTYVIISGIPNVDVNVKEGKIWLNQYITATTIDTPSFKKKEDNNTPSTVNESSTLSTFTGDTQLQTHSSSLTTNFSTKSQSPVKPQDISTMTQNTSFEASVNTDYVADDDLPF